MSVNKAEEGQEFVLIQRITELERQLRELRTAPQPLGASSLETVILPGVDKPLIFDLGTIASGGRNGKAQAMALDTAPLALCEYMFDVYVDGVKTSEGSPSLAKSQYELTWFVDNAAATITGGSFYRLINIDILNYHSASHTYRVDCYAIVPKVNGTVTLA